MYSTVLKMLMGASNAVTLQSSRPRNTGFSASIPPHLGARNCMSVLSRWVVYMFGWARSRINRSTSVEVFDAQTLQWETLVPMNQARHGHICTSFGAEGGALVAGGKCGMELLSSVEVYYPATNCWSTVKRLPVPLFSAAACLC